jgi:oxygen-dependent protoporphyrinogen oxidase
VTSKWAGRAPDDRRVIRAFAGGAFDPGALDATDEALAQRAHDDLAPILGLGAGPLVARVYRWIDASPQYDVGHGARIAAIDAATVATAGLYLTGAAYRGVGMPDVIADARATADRVSLWLDRG